MAFTKVKQALADGVVNWQETAKAASFTAVAGEGYFIDTSSAAITVTLPGSANIGDLISAVDLNANAASNNITFTSSANIFGSNNDAAIDYNNGAVNLIYSGATQGWIAIGQANEDGAATSEPAVPYTAKVLIVAGGGGGLKGAGVGGAGGGGVLEGDLTVTPGDSATVTVGGGGAAHTGGYGSTTDNASSQGSDSSVQIGSTTYTAFGGGRPGHSTTVGYNGGSGGGGGGAGSNGTYKVGGDATQTSATPLTGYGNDGGDATGNASGYTGAGGGGAGAVGQNTQSNYAGAGGNGHISTILSTTEATDNSVGEVNTTNVYFAGGGGGGSESQGYGAAGFGGAGRGVQGVNLDLTAAVYNGDANTGGGAGGPGIQSTVNATAGGSGVVIFRLTGKAGETITTDGTAVDSGSDKLVILKSSGSITF